MSCLEELSSEDEGQGNLSQQEGMQTEDGLKLAVLSHRYGTFQRGSREDPSPLPGDKESSGQDQVLSPIDAECWTSEHNGSEAHDHL